MSKVRWRPSGALRHARILLLAPLLLLSACFEDEKSAPPPPRAARVMEVIPQAAPLAEAEGAGHIEARNTADVGFLVAGRVIALPVDVGTTVKAGDLIARIDPVDFQNRLTAAQAQVATAQAAVDQAAPEEDRIRKLLDQGFATRAQHDEAQQALQTANAQLDGAHANLKIAEDQLKYTQLLAPVAGVVTTKGGQVGQVVAAGQMIVEIAQNGQLDAVFAVTARNVGYAHAGMPVKIWLQDTPSVTATGEVREIAPNADPVTGTYEVKVALADPPAQMRLGAIIMGRAEIPGGRLVRIPATALLQTGAAPQVWVVKQPGDTVTKRPVKVLRYDADGVLLSEGLNQGDLVVVAGVNSLADGQAVSLQKVAQK